MARWYETFLDVCKAAKRRSLGIAVHPSQKSAMMDMMERVAEDPLWRMGDLPPLLSHPDVPRDEYRFVTQDTLEQISYAAAVGAGTGIGRFSKLWTPERALKGR